MQSKGTYQPTTDATIEQLEAGTKSWIRPWRGPASRPHARLFDRRSLKYALIISHAF